jgi:hypothetical protein
MKHTGRTKTPNRRGAPKNDLIFDFFKTKKWKKNKALMVDGDGEILFCA